MPHKITKHACAVPGCPNLTEELYCDKHKALVGEKQKHYDRFYRSKDHNKKYGHEWRRYRERYVSEHPLCELCSLYGHLVPVEEVHHIWPVSRGGTNDRRNLISVCKSCHNRLHIALGDRR